MLRKYRRTVLESLNHTHPVIGEKRILLNLEALFLMNEQVISDYEVLTNIIFSTPNTIIQRHQLTGIMSNRGELEASGDKRMRSIEFHKQLGDERVIPAQELHKVFNHFAESDFDHNEIQPKAMAHKMVEENPNWGSIRYNTLRTEVLLSYSPWEYAEHDNLLNGNVTIKADVSERYNPKVQSDLEEQIGQLKYFEPVIEDKEVAAIQIPADPHIPKNYTEDLSDLANSL
jgi:hypothetical protein